jgi:hypothetical protein
MLAQQHHDPAISPRAGIVSQPSLQGRTVFEINRAQDMDVDREIVLRLCCMIEPAEHLFRRGEWIKVGEGARM